MQPLRTLGLLLLMILLCDADSLCTDIITLDPPAVIGERGEFVEVNCSSTEVDHVGMYWRKSNSSSEDSEDEKSFIAEFLQLSDWNLTAECIVMLNDSFKCSKELEITIYNKLSVSMYPTKYVPGWEEGVFYELQCEIFEVAPVQNLVVKWYKDKNIIKTDTFTNTTKRPVDESSSLIVSISREDDGAQFWCEAFLDFGPNGIKTLVKSEVHNVSVFYAPELKGDKKGQYHFLEEGDGITMDCEAEGNPPPVFNWTGDGVYLPEKTSNLALSGVNNTMIYNCTAYNLLGSVTKWFKVEVIKPAAAPETISEVSATTVPETTTPTYTTPLTPGCPLTLTPPEVVVRYGDPISVNCSTSDPDAFIMGWEAIVGGTGVKPPPTVTWKVGKLREWAIRPTCFLTDKNNEQCVVTPVITVYKTPDTVSVSAEVPGPVVEGKDFLLTCNVINVAPVQNLTIKWYQGDKIVNTKTFNATTVTPVNVSSNLSVSAKREYNGLAYTCKAELHLGPAGPEPIPSVTSLPFIADVRYPPVIKERSSKVEVNPGENVTFPCSAEGNPPPMIHWNYSPAGNVKETTGGRHRDISITEATSTNAGVYICNATNDMGSVTKSVTVIVIKTPDTVSVSAEVPGPVVEGKDFLLTCKVINVAPVQNLTIKWYQVNKIVKTQTFHDTTVTPLNVSSNLSVSAKREYNGLAYTCKAELHIGPAGPELLPTSTSLPFIADVRYPPVIKEKSSNVEVNPGENVTFSCSAEGNPPPMIHWNYSPAVNVKETTGGRHKIISITEATSTNTGDYICNATNDMGSVTKSFTVIVLSKTSSGPSWLWILIILCVALLLLIIIMIIFHNRRRKNGQYSFVSTDDIQMTGKPVA
ncbi:intercellular adhesion molecule 5 [Xyrichtys novacula]|uniref:Intercellular adhesion molecule 5 n=1 Tax=Xyrichtys novacula TaxID=13765 RepID=A0AAV1GSC3_XYRNO|nr:intercellular adhesion molecule 5 [Xyrichtys novacula]